AGAHTISYGAVDNAGNVEPRSAVSLSVGTFLADALAGLDSVSLSGGAEVTGTVRTNGSFTADGKSTVVGDVEALTADLRGRSAVTGSIARGRATLSDSAYDLAAAADWARARNDNAALPAGALNGGALALTGGSLVLPAGDYYLTGLRLSGQARLMVSGRVNILLDGPLSIDGGAELNAAGAADDLWLVAVAGDASISGNSRSAFNLYAPRSGLSVSGSGEFAGRVLAETASLSGKVLHPSTTSLPPSRHEPRPSGPLPSSRAARVKAAMPPLALSARAAFAAVGDEAGVVRAQDRSAVVIPEGAAAAGFAVTVSPPKMSDAIEHGRQAAAQSRKGLVAAAEGVQYGPEGARFAKPVTLELPYDRARLPAGISENDLFVHYWNPVNGDWEKLDSSVDARNQIVRAQTTHFSLYQIFGGGSGGASAPASVDDPTFKIHAGYAFPSPSRGGAPVVFRVQPGLADSVSVRVYDLSGRLVHESSDFRNLGSFDDGNGLGAQFTFEHAWDVSGVGSGVYHFLVKGRKAGERDIRMSGKVGVIK
ncbi:MAG: hypothetical protein HY403_08255, partial [Elusimicrobia bacterium]|nr:hypothetical protein [Elusimicrobiota bacterium]